MVLAELGRYPLMVLATVQVCKYWDRLLAMDDTRLVRLAFSESVRLAALPTRSAVRAHWAAQVASLLAVTPLPTTGPRHIDIKAELSALQQRYLASVSQSALPEVQLYLGQVADALCTDSYQMASYLKEVTSRAQLRRLAQLRTGSHQLRVETGRWERPRVAREQRICQRCLSGEVDDEHHMVFARRWKRLGCSMLACLQARPIFGLSWRPKPWALAALWRLGGGRELLERKGLVAVGGVGSGDGGVEGAQELVLRGAARLPGGEVAGVVGSDDAVGMGETVDGVEANVGAAVRVQDRRDI